MSPKPLLLPIFVFFCLSVFAQQEAPHSPHAFHQDQFRDASIKSEQDYDKQYGIKPEGLPARPGKCFLRKQVYGWHPAWRGTAYKAYDFSLLSTVAYFSYEVDPATGGYKSISHWRETELVKLAHEKGARVDLTASNFGAVANRELLSNPPAVKTLIDSLVALVKEKDADGVCIDFEGMASAQREEFTDFIRQLSAELKKEVEGGEVTVVLYAVDWTGVFDIQNLVPVTDRFVVMAYDYHWAGAPDAGPVAPLKASKVWGEQSDETSVKDYLGKGVPPEKLLLGVPYYGYRWPTASVSVPSKTTRAGKAVLYADLFKDYDSAKLQWDSAGSSPFLTGNDNGGDYQLWIDDARSLGDKYDYVNEKGIAGIGIWALGYDHGRDTLWKLIRSNFADCSASKEMKAPEGSTVLTGPTSRERNQFNWIWVLVGFGGTVVVILVVRILLKPNE